MLLDDISCNMLHVANLLREIARGEKFDTILCEGVVDYDSDGLIIVGYMFERSHCIPNLHFDLRIFKAYHYSYLNNQIYIS